MNKRVSVVSVWLIATVALGALIAVPTDADAQGRSSGTRASTLGARTHAPGVRTRAPGVRTHAYDRHGRAEVSRSHPAHRGARVGVVVGAPIITSQWWYGPYPYYYDYSPWPYYPPPVVYVQEQPTVYIEQAAPTAPPAGSAPPPEQYWYYCVDSKIYYPYVQTCASPWQRVLPHPPQ